MMNQKSERDVRALAEARFSQAKELEKQLWSLLEVKGPFDPQVRALRAASRDHYESILLADPFFAEERDVESLLWRLHYKRIEEFRARIRKYAASATAPLPPGSGVVPRLGNATSGGSTRREQLQKLLGMFRSFLAEASGFYNDLLSKLRVTSGLPLEGSSSLTRAFGNEHAKSESDDAAQLLRRQISCHRCLIYLGDLARYRGLHSESESSQRDWSVSAGYYLQAAATWHSSGNPHNQLAVLATYVEDELVAVYCYYRGLAAEIPFLTARGNLVLLFEKNRLRHPLAPAADLLEKGKSKGRIEQPATNLLSAAAARSGGDVVVVRDENDSRRKFRMNFVHLNGMIFTRSSLERFEDVLKAAAQGLEQLLATSDDDAALDSALGAELRWGVLSGWTSACAGAVHIVGIMIFTLHDAAVVAEQEHATYAQILQRSTLQGRAVKALFSVGALLLQRCCSSNSLTSSPLLPACLVLLEGLLGLPHLTQDSNGAVAIPSASVHATFWPCVAALLEKLQATQTQAEEAAIGFDHKGPANGQGSITFALWEDFELRGFQPLKGVHSGLDFTRGSPGVGVGAEAQRHARVRRILKAGGALARAMPYRTEGHLLESALQTPPPSAGDQAEKAAAVADSREALPNGLVPALPSEAQTWTLEGSVADDAAVEKQVEDEDERDDEEGVVDEGDDVPSWVEEPLPAQDWKPPAIDSLPDFFKTSQPPEKLSEPSGTNQAQGQQEEEEEEVILFRPTVDAAATAQRINVKPSVEARDVNNSDNQSEKVAGFGLQAREGGNGDQYALPHAQGLLPSFLADGFVEKDWVDPFAAGAAYGGRGPVPRWDQQEPTAFRAEPPSAHVSFNDWRAPVQALLPAQGSQPHPSGLAPRGIIGQHRPAAREPFQPFYAAPAEAPMGGLEALLANYASSTDESSARGTPSAEVHVRDDALTAELLSLLQATTGWTTPMQAPQIPLAPGQYGHGHANGPSTGNLYAPPEHEAAGQRPVAMPPQQVAAVPSAGSLGLRGAVAPSGSAQLYVSSARAPPGFEKRAPPAAAEGYRWLDAKSHARPAPPHQLQPLPSTAGMEALHSIWGLPPRSLAPANDLSAPQQPESPLGTSLGSMQPGQSPTGHLLTRNPFVP